MTMKVGLIFYTVTFTLLHSLGTTNANFTDTGAVSQRIKAGHWSTEDQWDRSSLTFTGNIVQENTRIAAEITNKGEDMAGTVAYEVWWSEKGNPKDGQKVDEGKVPALKSGQFVTLEYKTEKVGNYIFKSYQRPNHGDPNQKKAEEERALWSKPLSIEAQKQAPPTVPNDPPKNDSKPVQSTKPASKTEESSTPSKEVKKEEAAKEPTTKEPTTKEPPVKEPPASTQEKPSGEAEKMTEPPQGKENTEAEPIKAQETDTK